LDQWEREDAAKRAADDDGDAMMEEEEVSDYKSDDSD